MKDITDKFYRDFEGIADIMDLLNVKIFSLDSIADIKANYQDLSKNQYRSFNPHNYGNHGFLLNTALSLTPLSPSFDMMRATNYSSKGQESINLILLDSIGIKRTGFHGGILRAVNLNLHDDIRSDEGMNGIVFFTGTGSKIYPFADRATYDMAREISLESRYNVLAQAMPLMTTQRSYVSGMQNQMLRVLHIERNDIK